LAIPASRRPIVIWEKPSLVEIEMNAEIGSYQEDFESDDSPHPITRAQAPQAQASVAQSPQTSSESRS
jgi:hypothetical protein